MSFAIFLSEAVIISISGVMAPGPITAVTVGSGTKSPHAGIFVSLGHGIVEFPLMLFTIFGLGYILSLGYVKVAIFSLGGLFLLYMGSSMLRGIRHVVSGTEKSADSPFLAGILLTIGNVYFLLWWMTVGASLISKAVEFGIMGFMIFAVVHWLCDFVWLYTLSAVSFKGKNLLGVRFQQSVLLICGVFLVLFGIKFIGDAVILLGG